MVRESSSDEEDDLQALVPQHEVKPSSPHSNQHHRRAAFEIAGEVTTRICRGLRSRRWQWYVIAICLPLVLILVFFSLDLGRLFRGVSIIRADSPGDQMREAELRALYLLHSQQLGLLRIWNRTMLSSNASSPAIPSPPSENSSSVTVKNDLSLEDFRYALREQIKLNKQIQNALLSSHRGRNLSLEAVDNNVDSYLSSTWVDVCRKVNSGVDRRTIEWKPKKDRFLFAICVTGQMSNHLICLEKHMFFAALLGRVLVFPSHKLDFDYSQVLDINHINECLGREVVMSFEGYLAKVKNKLKIDRFICYTALPPCYLDEEHIKRMKNMGISLSKIEPAWPEDAKLKVQKKRIVADILPKFSSDEEVIAIGDMFYADVEEDWVLQPGGPIAHKCKTLIQPNRLIILTAQRFVQTFLGRNFIALHFRRHGFLKFCNVKKESCFYPIPQAAECILSIIERANAPVVYLSTDASESETNLLQSLVVLDGKLVPLVKRPSHNGAEKWDALLYRNHIGGESQVEAMLDKTISAMSTVFIGAAGSTFTEDILRLRRGWGTASQCDEYLCQGESPNFIAETE
ncbi:peptide-O-fucosyltransferase [Apostasia shenzhenica]|uniref:GDP-fucose protein O-fucosyltransferase 2 n=1 Tax=Apostasia shenzhenica TaxID=1088818 RepID=A0A2I0APE6_9ASPA|nr:peptide-O-fucosyltransferase [Apostasia shenzhenica]